MTVTRNAPARGAYDLSLYAPPGVYFRQEARGASGGSGGAGGGSEGAGGAEGGGGDDGGQQGGDSGGGGSQGGAQGGGSGGSQGGAQSGARRAGGSGSGAGRQDAQGGSQGAQGGAQDGGQERPTYDEEYVNRLRRESADNRKKADAAQAKLDELARKEMTELEREKTAREQAEKERDGLRSQVLRANRDRRILSAVSAANPVNPDPVAALISEQDVPHDDSGEPDPAKLSARIGELRKKFPHLFKASNQGNDAGSGRSNQNGAGAGKTDMNAAIRRGFGRPG